MLLQIVTICAFMAGASAQFQSCSLIHALNCTMYATLPVCATNGITYPNSCYFSKAQCIDKYLHIKHDGGCLPSEVSTTPTSGTDGEEVILDFFCTALSHVSCGTEDQPVCASDGWTYPNYCEYDKQRCTHRDLHVVIYGQCPVSSTGSPSP